MFVFFSVSFSGGAPSQHEASNNVRVKLKRLSLKSSGLYRCEVSAEAPNFSSDLGEGRMEIICEYILFYVIYFLFG